MASSVNSQNKRHRSMSDSASPLFGPKQPRYMRRHAFQLRNYKRPAFCAHCKQMLLGVVRQGMRCKRCDVDVHEKCQEDLVQPCVELIVGHHHFRLKSYKQLTYCDYCSKLLVGVMNQGLRCTECGANVHDKCQEKIETKCADVKARLQLQKYSTISGKHIKKGSTSQKNNKKMNSLSASLQNLQQSEDEELIKGQRAYSFQLMHQSSLGSDQPTSSSLPGSPIRQARQQRSRSLVPPAGQNLSEQINEVSNIMKENIIKATQREDNLNTLKIKSKSLTEKARLFDSKARDVKNKERWKNYRWWICLGVGAALLVAIIVVVVLLTNR